MNNNQATSIHIYNLAHGVGVNPLSKQYSIAFDSFTGTKSINIPSQLDDKFCNNCGQLNIPGLTTSSKIVYGKKKRGLRTTCLMCNGKNVDYSIIQEKEKSEDKPKPFIAEWPNKINNDNDDNYKSSKVNKETSKSKDRKKKRKQNNLANLLDIKKKQKVDEAKRSGSLNLMEFMK